MSRLSSNHPRWWTPERRQAASEKAKAWWASKTPVEQQQRRQAASEKAKAWWDSKSPAEQQRILVRRRANSSDEHMAESDQRVAAWRRAEMLEVDAISREVFTT